MREHELWVDFNDVAPDGTVTTLARFASTSLSLGQSLTVGDGDGNTAQAVVVGVDGAGLVRVRVV